MIGRWKNGCESHSLLPVLRAQLQTIHLAGAWPGWRDTGQRFLPPSTQRKNQARRREGGRPRDPLKGKPSLFSLFSPDCAGLRKSQSYPLCSSHTSPVFPFLRCLSLSYSPTNTAKTLPHLFFSPHFRHRPLTSSIARPPCFRFPSSYNYPSCSFLILRGLYRTFQLLHAKSPPLWKTFVTLHAMTSPEWFFFLTTSSLRSRYAKWYIQFMFHSLTGADMKKAGAWQVMPAEKSNSSEVRGPREARRRRIYHFFVSFVLCQQKNLKNNLYLLSVFTYSVY